VAGGREGHDARRSPAQMPAVGAASVGEGAHRYTYASYRAVRVLTAPDHVVWFWIGPHEEYEKVLYTR
jgi:hypothetical protein